MKEKANTLSTFGKILMTTLKGKVAPRLYEN
jgi:hypothetical protein